MTDFGSSSTDTHPSAKTRSRALPLGFAALLLVAELAGIKMLFNHAISFNCGDYWPHEVCSAVSLSIVSLYCLAAAVVLMAMLAPAPLLGLTERAGARLWPLITNALGVGIALIPMSFIKLGAELATIVPVFACWTVGMALILGGLAGFIAPKQLWDRFLRENLSTLLPILAVSLVAPWLAIELQPVWRLETIASATFALVAYGLQGLGYTVDVYAEQRIIGAGEFYIDVAPACSGVEGIALVTLFVSLYLCLFRRDLRFPRALLLYPVGIAASAVFNVVRIAALLVIGLEGNPELAVGGFHSRAGWLMFTLVALGILGLAQTVPALQKAPVEGGSAARAVPAAALPFFQDPTVARILPFAVFMLSALLASTFTQSPGVVYPLRVLAVGGCLTLFWAVLRKLSWRFDPVAGLVGLGVGVMWVVIPVAPIDVAPYGTLSGAMLVGWFILRGVGTIVLVPVVEELFFRDYLERLLRIGRGRLWSVTAAVVTAAIFAGLHDRWAEAFVAGIAFSWVMQRHGRVVDAIAAHAVANAVVFAVAVAAGNLAIL